MSRAAFSIPENRTNHSVIPAQAGIQGQGFLDPGLRRGDAFSYLPQAELASLSFRCRLRDSMFSPSTNAEKAIAA